MGELHLCLLGSPQIFVDGEEKILSERKAIAFLAYLAVERKVQGRDTLAALFWPEHDQQRARANLRYLLWSLRKRVGEGWLATDGDQIALAGAGKIRVDVEEFRQHLAAWRGHSHTAGAYCAACVESLEAALQLYRGDFLQGFTLDDSPQFDDWQFFQAEELRRTLAAGLEALVEQQIVGQRHATAIGYARRWLALDPLHEPACRALMKLYAWSGQYEAAIRQFHQCAQTLQEEIGVQPDAQTLQLYAQIRNRRFPLPSTQSDQSAAISQPTAMAATDAGNLPPVSTAFVGRQTELAQIAQRLADPATHLLTIVGPGGIGKSTLALQAGHAEEARFPAGVWFVPLAGMESAERVPAAILAALGVPAGGGSTPHQQLLLHLRGKHSLLILDNFEDVLPAAELMAELLRTCPQVKLIVTTRERLNLRDEWLLTLGNLSYPTDAKAAGAERREYSALRLFEICAQRTQPAFALDSANLPSVIRICQLVDGMPLALEMAAAWVRVLPVAEIPGEIERSLSFLSTSARDVAERQRSIHAVFDHSWQLLTERERSVLRQLAVFRNGFSREGAEAVAAASLLDLSALLDKSWLRLNGDGRYQMHGLAQNYAAEKLHNEHSALTNEAVGDVLHRHCLFFAAQVPPEGRFVKVTAIVPTADVENVQLAWQTALQQRHWRDLEQLTVFIEIIMQTWWDPAILPHLERGIGQLETVLQSVPVGTGEFRQSSEAPLAKILHVAGEYYTHLGKLIQAIDHLSRGRSLFESHRSNSHAAGATHADITTSLGFAFYYAGQFDKAEVLYQEALTAYENVADRRGMIVVRLLLAQVYGRRGSYKEAEESVRLADTAQREMGRWNQSLNRELGRILTKQGRYQEARAVLEQSFEETAHRYRSHTLLFLGMAVRGQSNAAEAQEILQRGLAIAEETGDRPAQSDLLAELGFTAIQHGEAALAQKHFSRSLAIAREIGRLRTVPLALMGLGQVELMQGHWQEARDYFTQALAAAIQVNAPPDLLDVLVSVGELYAAEGKPAAALEFLDLAARHPATTHETRSRAQRLLQTLGAEDAASESKLATDEARTRLEEAARATLAKLQIPTNPDSGAASPDPES